MNVDISDSPAAQQAISRGDTSGSFPGLRDAVYVHLFSVPLMTYVWTDMLVLNRQLRERIVAQARTEASQQVTNLGGWRSVNSHLEFLGELREPLVERMLAMANEATNRLTAERRVAPISPQWSFTAWANVSESGDLHTTHTHAGATWSGVYYVDAGESDGQQDSGRLRFLDPAPGSGSSFFSFVARVVPEIRPVAGLMVLFPSYVPHMVHPHRGSRPRISIAFNFRNEPYP
jgi:uncharacterized protein (TIGR02466 family)